MTGAKCHLFNVLGNPKASLRSKLVAKQGAKKMEA
jgi:hypothetical protein